MQPPHEPRARAWHELPPRVCDFLLARGAGKGGRAGTTTTARRAYCCHQARTLGTTVQLPPDIGGTRCSVRLFGVCPFRTVEIHELADNPGAPASACLDAITRWVRAELIRCRHEPIWLEYSPARALLAVLHEEPVVSARHELWETQGQWFRVPLPRERYAALRRLNRDRRRGHLSGGGPQPW